MNANSEESLGWAPDAGSYCNCCRPSTRGAPQLRSAYFRTSRHPLSSIRAAAAAPGCITYRQDAPRRPLCSLPAACSAPHRLGVVRRQSAACGSPRLHCNRHPHAECRQLGVPRCRCGPVSSCSGPPGCDASSSSSSGYRSWQPTQSQKRRRCDSFRAPDHRCHCRRRVASCANRNCPARPPSSNRCCCHASLVLPTLLTRQPSCHTLQERSPIDYPQVGLCVLGWSSPSGSGSCDRSCSGAPCPAAPNAPHMACRRCRSGSRRSPAGAPTSSQSLRSCRRRCPSRCRATPRCGRAALGHPGLGLVCSSSGAGSRMPASQQPARSILGESAVLRRHTGAGISRRFSRALGCPCSACCLLAQMPDEEEEEEKEKKPDKEDPDEDRPKPDEPAPSEE